jgi:hypothetical protein
MKVNVDVAISKNLGKAFMAVVARDQAGMFLGALGVVFEGITMLKQPRLLHAKKV